MKTNKKKVTAAKAKKNPANAAGSKKAKTKNKMGKSGPKWAKRVDERGPKTKKLQKVATSGQSTAKPDGKSVGLTGSLNLLSYLRDESWRNALASEFQKPYFQSLLRFLAEEYRSKEIFPTPYLVFNAFNQTPLAVVKVVILGQDPYHDQAQAHGLAFSVPPGVAVPPSLRNIFKELARDIPGFEVPPHGNLLRWASAEGVLLLNAALTVEAHRANSHARVGWHTFTDHVIGTLSARRHGLVFILWGGFARGKAKLIDTGKHSVIEAAHPSPLSASKFFGCKCFSEANRILEGKYRKTPVDWTV